MQSIASYSAANVAVQLVMVLKVIRISWKLGL